MVRFAMTPCKITSPAFAVTAAILGGIALAVTTCQANAAAIDLSENTSLAADPENANDSKTERLDKPHSR